MSDLSGGASVVLKVGINPNSNPANFIVRVDGTTFASLTASSIASQTATFTGGTKSTGSSWTGSNNRTDFGLMTVNLPVGVPDSALIEVIYQVSGSATADYDFIVSAAPVPQHLLLVGSTPLISAASIKDSEQF